jgi:CRP-like cAMP-binding protein
VRWHFCVISRKQPILHPTPCHECPLRRLPAIKTHSPEEVDFIQRQKTAEVSYRAGAILVQEGQRDERLFTLLSGWAFRFKALPDGRRQILNFLLPGDLIGLQGRLFDEAPHGVEALSAVTLCAFTRERTWEVFREYPALAYDLTWLCAHEERLIDEGLLSVGRRTALERVAVLIAHLWSRARQLELVADGLLPFPLTQAHIADALGLSAVHTNRTLQILRRRGLLVLAGGVLSGVDEDALRRLARYNLPETARPLY